MKVVIASSNSHKQLEISRMLDRLGIEILSPAQAGVCPQVEETGETFEENARLKAAAFCEASGLPAIADDSGLCVDALGGAPGVYSARYAGPDADDGDRIEKLLGELAGVPVEKRTARFVCVLCCVFPDGRELSARGECEGSIAFQQSGIDGFGYDPVFIEKNSGRTFAQLTGPEKDGVSHRGRALAGLTRLLGESLAYPAQTDKKTGGKKMLTSKQRATLKGMANSYETIVQIGRAGVTENVSKQAKDALFARELIKLRVLEGCPLSAREAAEQLATELEAEVVQVIGTRFVLFKSNPEKPVIEV